MPGPRDDIIAAMMAQRPTPEMRSYNPPLRERIALSTVSVNSASVSGLPPTKPAMSPRNAATDAPVFFAFPRACTRYGAARSPPLHSP